MYTYYIHVLYYINVYLFCLLFTSSINNTKYKRTKTDLICTQTVTELQKIEILFTKSQKARDNLCENIKKLEKEANHTKSLNQNFKTNSKLLDQKIGILKIERVR